MANENEADMRLKEGIGVVPPEQRNKGYDKLGYAPGEGGLRLPDAKDDTPRKRR